MTERTISDLLKEMNTFGDHALLRRALVDYGLAVRTPTGNAYRCIEQRPPAELEPLLARIGGAGIEVAASIRRPNP